MAEKYLFGGKEIVQPGPYSEIKSGVKNTPQDLSVGGVTIIDAGLGAGYGGGAGVLGTLTSGKKANYTFNEISDFRNFVKGGLYWDLALPLFKPDKLGVPGVSFIEYISAKASTPASLTLALSGIGTGATFTVTAASGIITAITVTNGGSGYSVPPTIAIVGTGTGATATAIVSQGKITSITVTAGGTGYTGTPTATATSPTGGGSLQLQVKDEGLIGNGVLTSGNLSKGYAITLSKGIIDPSKVIFNFYRGDYKGVDVDGDIYDGISASVIPPVFLFKSKEVGNFTELSAWINRSTAFNALFNVLASTPAGNGVISTTSVTTLSGYNLFAGGTETYSSAALDAALDAIKGSKTSFILLGDYNDNYDSANNLKIASFNQDEARFKKQLYVGGGQDEEDFEDISVAAAMFYDDMNVSVVHGGPLRNKSVGGFKTLSVIYKTARILGREAGQLSQVPITFKSINIDGEVHVLTEKQKDRSIETGVIVTYYDDDFQEFTILKGVNTLQNNDNEVNEDGTTPSKQIVRIANQLNMEIPIFAKIELFGQPNGVNRNTLSKEDIKAWTEGYLTRKTAGSTTDNIILSYENVVILTKGTAYFVSYGFEPNFEVNFAFFTGFILDNNN